MESTIADKCYTTLSRLETTLGTIHEYLDSTQTGEEPNDTAVDGFLLPEFLEKQHTDVLACISVLYSKLHGDEVI